MKKIFVFNILFFCGILNICSQSWLEKQLAKQYEPRNYVYKTNGYFFLKKKNGKEKKVTIIKHDIDTLFVESTLIHASFFAENYMVDKFKIKHIVINGVAYSFDEKEKDLSKIQGFQTINIYSKRGKPSGQIILSNAIVIDGDDEKNYDYKGYFANSSITKVVLSSKIRKIGKGAFRGCKGLREIVFPNGVKNVEIAPDAFAGCMNLDESGIIVPNGRNDIKEAIIKSAALLKNESTNVPREIKWSSEKNCEIFDIRNCYLYFDKCKYQYFKNGTDIIKHGEIECTNGKYHFVWDNEWRRNNVCVKGSYNKGNKDGQWHYSEEYVYKGKQYISEVTANYRNGKLNGEYRYTKKENGKSIIIVLCNFIEGKPYGKYYEKRNKKETIIYYDEYGTKTGPMTIVTEDEEHHGRFEHDYLYDYYYIDKKTKEKFTPADMQGKNKNVKLLQFTDDSGDNAGIVLCGIIGTGTTID